MKTDPVRTETAGRILFLHGYPSALWLGHIGSRFNIDPEFYFRHLDFASFQGTPEHFFMHSLPSAADILRVRVTTVLSSNDPSSPAGETVANLRARC